MANPMTGSMHHDALQTPRRWALALVLAHAAVNIAHGSAHVAKGILLPPAANAFVVLVILLAPLLALGLLYSRRPRAGAWLLLAAMLGALLFGVANHLLLPGPDNVAEVGDEGWGLTFQASAWLLAGLEASGAFVGGWILKILR